MAISNEQVATYIASEAIPYGYVVSLTGSNTGGQATVKKAEYDDDTELVIGIALDEAASGAAIPVMPLGRGAVTRVAVEYSETVAIGDILRLSDTQAGTVDNNGYIALGMCVKGCTSDADAVAYAEIQTWFPVADLET